VEVEVDQIQEVQVQLFQLVKLVVRVVVEQEIVALPLVEQLVLRVKVMQVVLVLILVDQIPQVVEVELVLLVEMQLNLQVELVV
tara:strand:- start:237 stop:488 length:252 start_codon:yes stop_codon:yes gene_type:complete